MSQLAYAGMLVACLLGTAWLEIWPGTRVYRRWWRLLRTLGMVAPVFLAWDLYAVAAGHWTFAPALTLGVRLPGGLPLEEVLFFVVVPLAAVLAFEAVRAVTRWRAGDEPPAGS